MKTQLAAALVEGQRVDTVFSIRARELRSTRHGEAYLALELADRSGIVPGVMFKPPRTAEGIPAGTVVRVSGVVTSFRGVRRISVEEMRIAEDYDVGDLLPRSTREASEAVQQLRELVKAIRDPAIATVVKAVFADKRFFRAFSRSPASVADHHAYVGGLLDHTVAVASVCEAYAGVCPGLDRDLLVAGALLHDIGVVDAIRVGAGFELTREGRLLGHAVLGERRLTQASTGIRPEIAAHLSHLVLSHHRDGEQSAPHPCTLEALVLSHIDAADRDADSFSAALTGAMRVEEEWTDSSNRFGRPLYAAATERLRTA
ncbi:MAG: HD domain-containing protein [Coriobacteriia bacterium]|nr:HD domain-containing protein [Coriobacteriia bacterium]